MRPETQLPCCRGRACVRPCRTAGPHRRLSMSRRRPGCPRTDELYRVDNSYMLDSMRTHRGAFSEIGIVNADGPNPDRDMRAWWNAACAASASCPVDSTTRCNTSARRDSSRRSSLVRDKRVEMSLDPVGTSACATSGMLISGRRAPPAVRRKSSAGISGAYAAFGHRC